jgi:hypothetical protein
MNKWLKKQTDFGIRKNAPWHYNAMIVGVLIVGAFIGFSTDAPTIVFVGLGLGVGLLYRSFTKGKYSKEIQGDE